MVNRFSASCFTDRLKDRVYRNETHSFKSNKLSGQQLVMNFSPSVGNNHSSSNLWNDKLLLIDWLVAAIQHLLSVESRNNKDSSSTAAPQSSLFHHPHQDSSASYIVIECNSGIDCFQYNSQCHSDGSSVASIHESVKGLTDSFDVNHRLSWSSPCLSSSSQSFSRLPWCPYLRIPCTTSCLSLFNIVEDWVRYQCQIFLLENDLLHIKVWRESFKSGEC